MLNRRQTQPTTKHTAERPMPRSPRLRVGGSGPSNANPIQARTSAPVNPPHADTPTPANRRPPPPLRPLAITPPKTAPPARCSSVQVAAQSQKQTSTTKRKTPGPVRLRGSVDGGEGSLACDGGKLREWEVKTDEGEGGGGGRGKGWGGGLGAGAECGEEAGQECEVVTDGDEVVAVEVRRARPAELAKEL